MDIVRSLEWGFYSPELRADQQQMETIVEVGLEEFRQSWLESVRAGNPSTRELGRRFSLKLVSQWKDLSEESADVVLCDGACDGGIDIALLDTGSEAATDAQEESGHTWYLVQSKYGSAFAGVNTLLAEGQKVIDTLDGKRSKLNSLAEGTLERLTNFRNGAGPLDQIAGSSKTLFSVPWVKYESITSMAESRRAGRASSDSMTATKASETVRRSGTCPAREIASLRRSIATK
jgi:hypothetical protein